MVLPSPPFVHIPGLKNFRDLGGYPVAGQPGKIVKRGLVFRASEPSKITDEGIAKLNELGITHVYDLRSEVEIQRDAAAAGRSVKEWDGAKRVFVPVFREQDYSPEAIALRYSGYSSEGPEGFVRIYQDILSAASAADHPHAPYATILEHLASSTSTPTPLLVHCTAGKDRTGVICALILSLCGVEDEAVAHEYSLTELGLQERKEEFVNELVKVDALRGNRAGAERMVSARKESMLATLAMIREKFGSVEKLVTEEFRISPESIAQIRRNLVVDVQDGEAPLDWQSHAELVP